MKKLFKKTKLLVGCFILCMVVLTGCGKKESDSKKDAEVEVKDYIAMQTSIAYSAGDTKNWSYGNQRKEFPNDDCCYVRIGTTAITTAKTGKGKGDQVEVTYRFTGTKDCKAEVSDGKVEEVDTKDDNVTEFTHTVVVEKESKRRYSYFQIFT